jgi:rRNA maturation RNase YbeY
MQMNVFYNLPLKPYYKKTSLYKRVAIAALGKRARKEGEVNIIIVGKKEILKINKQFLGHNYVTDVITFEYDEGGDIFVCFDAARKQAKERGHGALKEIFVLIAHGALHLIGWKDDTPLQRMKMNSKAEEIAGVYSS